MNRPRILITGVSGLLGSNLALLYKDRYDILGIYHEHPVVISGVRTIGLDLLDRVAFEHAVMAFRPNILIHCMALASIDTCEQYRDLAYKMNVIATENTIREFKGLQIKNIYISTDAVYEGAQSYYSENDPAHPLNYYAQTKLMGEEAALQVPRTLVLRTSFYGWNIRPGKLSLAEWMIDQLAKNNSLNGFTNVISSNIYIRDLAQIIEDMVHKDLNGVYNIGCHTGMSKYDFARALAVQFGFAPDLVRPFNVDQFNFKARRGKDLSLSVAKIEKTLNRPMPDSKSGLLPFYKDKDIWKILETL